MNLAEIAWPVFKLGEREPQQQDGIVYYHTNYVDELNTSSISFKVVDDKNIVGSTLGLRRLVLKSQGETLFAIRTAIYLLADLVKLAKSKTWFIDNSGNVFQYRKTIRAKLVTKKIKQILPADGLGCVLELEGISSRFKCMRRPGEFESYARVLKYSMGFIFYGFCDSVEPDSWRMV